MGEIRLAQPAPAGEGSQEGLLDSVLGAGRIAEKYIGQTAKRQVVGVEERAELHADGPTGVVPCRRPGINGHTYT